MQGLHTEKKNCESAQGGLESAMRGTGIVPSRAPSGLSTTFPTHPAPGQCYSTDGFSAPASNCRADPRMALSKPRLRRFRIINAVNPLLFFLVIGGGIGGGGCTSNSRLAVNVAPSPSGSTSASSLSSSSVLISKTARFYFKQSGTSGSFDAPGSGGTLAVPGGGHKATRAFNADGTLLASGSTSESWPKWVSSVEVGVSGSSNGSATNPSCARFSQSGEDTNTVCNFNLTSGTDTDPVPCGAPVGLFRVSEYDCTNGASARDGTGGGDDGVYIRVVLDRSKTGGLAANENILAVLEYASSAFNSAPLTPTSCFANGLFTPSNPGCADSVWQIYLKHSAGEVVQPYLMLTPPFSGYVNTARNTGGGGTTTKQFLMPTAADENLSVIQISRIKALGFTSTNFTTACSSNSALCVGMVFYALTLYRI